MARGQAPGQAGRRAQGYTVGLGQAPDNQPMLRVRMTRPRKGPGPGWARGQKETPPGHLDMEETQTGQGCPPP